MKIVAALGGNALLRRGEALSQDAQTRNAATAAAALAPLIGAHEIIVTHGNGPQVGLLALQAAAFKGAPMPLDVLSAESEGMIGYTLERELRQLMPSRRFATLLTQVAVDPRDPAFAHPTKPVGPVYDAAEAARVAAQTGWTMARDGQGMRRVVPSPAPQAILELDAITLLAEHGVTVTCAGGGGIPVAIGADCAIRGVEAVIDKDAASALLAEKTGADFLLMLTDVPAVMQDFGTPHARAIRRAGPEALAALAFAEGSMGPKVAAAIHLARLGKQAGIGALGDAARILAGEVGTLISADGGGLAYW